MKAGLRLPLLLGSMLFASVPLGPAEEFPLTLKPRGATVELSWPTATAVGQQTVFPEYQVESSSDLSQWTPVPGKLRGVAGRSGSAFSLSFSQGEGRRFYRVRANLTPAGKDLLGEGGEEVFGYGTRFQEELSRIGRMPARDFLTNGAGVSYLPSLTWDPTTALCWTNFYTTNLFLEAFGDPARPQYLPYSYRLNDQELAVFMTNGFVVSERMEIGSFGDAYFRIFNADLPVFITADSVLHAWHRTYQSMLEELEELQLATLLERVVSNMSMALPQTRQQYGSGPLGSSIQDADYFLTVARSLWMGAQQPSPSGNAEVDSQVTAALNGVQSLQLTKVPMFGGYRMVDFSQFKVRGHYDGSERLRRYFRAMMWCGRTDLRVATYGPNEEADVRQLGTAVVLHYLLKQSGEMTNWALIEQIVGTFVGPTDSMTFHQMDALLATSGIDSLADVPDLVTLTNLQTRLLSGELGMQSIQSDFFYSPLGPGEMKLPRSFTFCGQKFILDSWAMSQVVFDRIHWAPDDGNKVIDGKVIRRKPSCLDVAYAVFGNQHIVPEIVARIESVGGVPFRDGLPYQHNLLAVRNTIESQGAGSWTNNIYAAWLRALRALSAPTTDPVYPECMRTRAWAMKTLNTQLASWSQLRHDTILYAKQSYTGPMMCGYPAGFVEPRPEFWRCMKELADLTACAISGLSLSGVISVPSRVPSYPSSQVLDLAGVKSEQLRFLADFAARMTTLRGIAEKELAQQALTQAESNFLQDVVEMYSEGYLGVRHWNGWYPRLFYVNRLGGDLSASPPCAVWDPLVADVHTDLPDEVVNDPGAVIHEAVGNVHMMLIAVDNGPDRMVYAGPVLSHYEFEEPGVKRLSDSEWQNRLSGGPKPPSPEWTRSYLLPK